MRASPYLFLSADNVKEILFFNNIHPKGSKTGDFGVHNF
jgi:hypothetical protein